MIRLLLLSLILIAPIAQAEHHRGHAVQHLLMAAWHIMDAIREETYNDPEFQ